MAGFHLAIECLAVNNLVAIGRGRRDDALVDHPAGNVAVALVLGIGTDRDRAHHVHPSRRALQHRDLAPALNVGKLGRAGAGRHINHALPYHDAALDCQHGMHASMSSAGMNP